MSVPTRMWWGGGVLLLAAALLAPFSSADSRIIGIIDKSAAEVLAKDIEVQARGPVHEAFAHPPDLKPEPGPVIAMKPPQAIPELPADLKPDGENVQWIPGYWAWDADQNTFIWVSGVYRDAPPGRRYVPGYWIETPEGWRWVPGFWAPEQQGELSYYPEPPATLDYGPSFAPPGDDYCYAPGYWSYYSNRYYWRPGHWVPCYPGYVWTYPHWCWTPRGYCFVSGYWDYPLERRGVLFAPVAFHRPFWNTPGWAYRPNFAVGINTPWFSALFTGGSHRRYYFGDYYGSSYAGLGYRPWHSGSRYHDPLLGYYRWNHRHDPSWYAGVQQLAADRSAGRAQRPPRTAAQQAIVLNQTINVNNSNTVRNGNRPNQPNTLQVVTPLNQLKTPELKLAKVNSAQLNLQKAAADRVRDIAQNRKSFEASAGLSANGRGTRPTLKLPTPQVTTNLNSSTQTTIKPALTDRPSEPRRSFEKSKNGSKSGTTPSFVPKDSGNGRFGSSGKRFSDFKPAAPAVTPPVNNVTPTPPQLKPPVQQPTNPPTSAPAQPKATVQPFTNLKPPVKQLTNPPSTSPAPPKATVQPFTNPTPAPPPKVFQNPPKIEPPVQPKPTIAPSSQPPRTAPPRTFNSPPSQPKPTPRFDPPRTFSSPPSPPKSSFSPAPSPPRSFSPPPSSSPGPSKSFSPPPPSSSGPARSFSPPPSSSPGPSKSFSPPRSSSSGPSKSFSPPPSSSSSSKSSSSSSGSGSSRSFSPSSSGSSSSRSSSPPSSSSSRGSSPPSSSGGGRKR